MKAFHLNPSEPNSMNDAVYLGKCCSDASRFARVASLAFVCHTVTTAT